MKKITTFIVFGAFLCFGLFLGIVCAPHDGYGAGRYHGYYGRYHGYYGGWWWGPAFVGGAVLGTALAYPYYYYPYPYTYAQPLQPQVYAEPQQEYWYYCKDPQGYYPYVTSCPGGWLRVVPTPPQPAKEEVVK